jgi:hypothetical protein
MVGTLVHVASIICLTKYNLYVIYILLNAYYNKIMLYIFLLPF